jgi:hypothetical protein
MITVQVRKSAQQYLLDRSTYRVEGKLTHDIADDDNTGTAWTFIVVSGNVDDLFHSNTAGEQQYLNYANPNNPTLEIKSSTGESCSIKLVARVYKKVIKNMEVTYLDKDDNLLTEFKDVEGIEIIESESGVIDLFDEDAYV